MATEKRLTEKDKDAYFAIESFIKENGYHPTTRELCRILSKSTTSSIMYRLESLEKKGYVKNNDGGRRTIRIIKRIENANTVGAVEVVHGRWMFVDIDGWWFNECSICGDTTPNRDGNTPDWNYCPNCGAKMDGDGNG